jgi:hypothetical protein
MLAACQAAKQQHQAPLKADGLRRWETNQVLVLELTQHLHAYITCLMKNYATPALQDQSQHVTMTQAAPSSKA